MKKLNPYVILIAILVLFSCSNDDEVITENAIESNLELSIPQASESGRTPINEEEFKLNMTWISFITAKSLYASDYETVTFNDDVRLDFANIMASQDAILLEDLIGDNANGDFKDAFHATLASTIQGVIEYEECLNDPANCGAPEPPETSPPLPPGGSGPNGTPTTGISTAEEVVDYLLDYVLNQHCLEVYVPKYISATAIVEEIATTTHPLSSASSNEASVFTNEINPEPSNYNQYIYGDIISPLYLSSVNSVDKYVIITRPKRSRKCLYPEYFRIDFTNFFN
ncbi:hypothetical protein [Dokdonia pacifica]|uniref:Uncharacterized protein n=1 Tax=Dokdonia pacifica TaxID=1627892 RepID=A0A238ZV73_9FLAO|nr:hypothetical protein [Dokdonia pacifica]SNR86563.1 hypothetical protein SAMN06265376_103497 [Dokdonia pacifica]